MVASLVIAVALAGAAEPRILSEVEKDVFERMKVGQILI